ncbi:hypothetical protein J4H86_13595 [Spiractinospora alimapuensis]|uniref:hypothetical protein n=1 Tax=Spiractinospora alimapuensis TaxID=2820884 RepID=UPI001F349548|nr:hypothetical protein [Spiractinospora alimapuensis]QVQ50008.1 hypothetical protein J4H86_13595 [Spiractinospora alimapuensis]
MGEHDGLRGFFDDYGGALATGDINRLADCYAYPTFALGDDQSLAMSDRDAATTAFSGATEHFGGPGMAVAAPTLTAVEELTPTLTSVDVRWSYSDAGGTERGGESYRYVVRATAGRHAICAVIPTNREV